MAKAKTAKRRTPTIDELANFPPMFDRPTMHDLENVAHGQTLGVHRRVSLAVLTMSADELADTSKSDPTTYAEMRRAVASFKTHADGLQRIALAAEIRLDIADVGDAARAA